MTSRVPDMRDYVSYRVADGIRVLSEDEKARHIDRLRRALARLSKKN